jgi:hypothetical protein
MAQTSSTRAVEVLPFRGATIVIGSIAAGRPTLDRLVGEEASVACSAVQEDDRRAAGARVFRKITAVLEDAVLLLLIVLLFPLIILLLGMPIALIVRAVIEIAHRFL